MLRLNSSLQSSQSPLLFLLVSHSTTIPHLKILYVYPCLVIGLKFYFILFQNSSLDSHSLIPLPCIPSLSSCLLSSLSLPTDLLPFSSIPLHSIPYHPILLSKLTTQPLNLPSLLPSQAYPLLPCISSLSLCVHSLFPLPPSFLYLCFITPPPTPCLPSAVTW